jgi:hypothetical protein
MCPAIYGVVWHNLGAMNELRNTIFSFFGPPLPV